MKTRTCIPACLGWLLLLSVPAPAGTFVVNPGEYIQDAIDAASGGDTVLVRNGTYLAKPSDNSRIYIKGKSITVRSEHGPDSTTIVNAEVNFVAGETRSARLEGFTITHAAGPKWEFGVRFDTSTSGTPSSGTITNCRFVDGFSSGVGALDGATPLIQNCQFIRAGFYDGFGGGVRSYYNSDTEIDHCYFEQCIGWGGALMAEWSGQITASYCSFVRCGDNDPGNPDLFTKSGIGGAASVNYDGHIDLDHCTVFGSYADAGGAAFDANDGTINLDYCIVAFSRDPENSDQTFSCGTSGDINLTCCDVYGNAAGNYTDCAAGQGGLHDNFSLDPLFCDTLVDDINLRESSPCIAHATCGQVGAYGEGCTGYTGPYWHVATTGSDATGDGSAGNPFATIQYAIDQSSDGDYVMVHNGIHHGPGNRLIDYHGRSVTVQSEFGPDSTVIDCDTLRGFIFDNHEDTTFRLRGFTIREGSEEAIWCDNAGSPLIEDCIFAENIRGITCRDSACPIIRRCTFLNNYYPDGYMGGGIGTGSAIDCTAGIDTTGLDTTRRSNPFIDSCVFEGNRATIGAAIRCWHSMPEIQHSLFLRNGFADTTGVGSGVYVSDGEGPRITQCTFVGNLASTGSAVAVQLDGHLTLDRCILASNVVRLGTGRVVYCNHAGYVEMTSCNVYGNLHGDYLGCIAGMEGMDGNVSLDPIFCDPAADDYGLRGHSPCVPGHPLNTCVDYIGAFEVDCEGPVWIVSTTGDDVTGDGTVAAPWGTIQYGLDQTPAGDTLLLLPGEYTGIGNHLVSWGGQGKVLTSYFGADSTTVNVENHAHAITFDEREDSVAVVHGLTFRGASQSAIRCDSSSPTIHRCTFRFNNISVDCWDSSDVSIGYCDFISNINPTGSVSGVACHFSSPTVRHCYFEGNRTFSGGAAYCAGNTATPLFEYCRFIRNGHELYQTSHGAGLQAFMDAHPLVRNCTFFGNMADWGSALYTQDADITVENSIIAYNWDSWTGFPIFCLGFNDEIDLACCNVYGNYRGDFHDCVGGEEHQDGNFSANPLFCDTAAGDFHLALNSRCAANHNGCAVLIGALDTACTAIANTPTGTDVNINPGEGVTVTFEDVTGDGNTDVVQQTGGPAPPGGLATLPSDPTTYYNVTTTALYTGEIEICVAYDEADLTSTERDLTLQHYDGSAWADITSSHDMISNIICGVTTSLSAFIIAQDTVGNAAPTGFVRLLPLDSALVPSPVELTWSGCTDPDGDTIAYHLRIAVQTVDTTLIVADTSYTLWMDSLGFGSAHYDVHWQVYAHDGTDSMEAVNGPGDFVCAHTVDVPAAGNPIVPETYALAQNYPNPFNPNTEIRFALPRAGRVELVIFNLLGQRVISLVKNTWPAGYHRVSWDGRAEDGRPVGSGVYFYRLRAGTFVTTKTMVLLR